MVRTACRSEPVVIVKMPANPGRHGIQLTQLPSFGPSPLFHGAPTGTRTQTVRILSEEDRRSATRRNGFAEVPYRL